LTAVLKLTANFEVLNFLRMTSLSC